LVWDNLPIDVINLCGVLIAPQRAFIDATLVKWGERARWTDR
jgi:hypothetical protein